MNTALKAPNKTRIIDVSDLLDNVTSQLYLKMENEQITGSHKYRLVYGMMTAFLEHTALSEFDYFVEASSGSTGLALAELASQVNKRSMILTTSNINDRTLRKIDEIQGSDLMYFGSIDEAIEYAKRLDNEAGVNLNQYDNKDALISLKDMAYEINGQVEGVSTVVMGVGTGASIAGLSYVFPDCHTVAVTIDDQWLTIPGWKNFAVSKAGDIILNNMNGINHWERITIEEMANSQSKFAKYLGFNPNLSTVGNLIAAISHGNKCNDSVVVTLCTGEEK